MQSCTSKLPVALALLAGVTYAVDRPQVIDLPVGFRPEGITKGRDWTAYVGSLADGAIWKGDLREGRGEVVVEGVGTPSVGLDYDKRTDYLYVCGGPSGTARVYDSNNELVREIVLGTTDGSSFVNDVIVTSRYVYFTDSFQPQFYAVPLESGGRLADEDPVTIPLSGDFEFVDGTFNSNGIEASDDASMLIIASGATTSLYLVDSETGTASTITLSSFLGPDGSIDPATALTSIAPDGLVRRRNTLWACENGLGRGTQLIAEIVLSEDWTCGIITRVYTSDLLDTPTTADRWMNGIYAVNAKFFTSEEDTADQTYEIVRIDRDEPTTTC